MGDKIKKSCKDRDSITFDFLILLIIIIKKEIRDQLSPWRQFTIKKDWLWGWSKLFEENDSFRRFAVIVEDCFNITLLVQTLICTAMFCLTGYRMITVRLDIVNFLTISISNFSYKLQNFSPPVRGPGGGGCADSWNHIFHHTRDLHHASSFHLLLRGRNSSRRSCVLSN